MTNILPITVVKHTVGVRKIRFGVRYANGKIVHDCTSREGAEQMAAKLTKMVEANQQK